MERSERIRNVFIEILKFYSKQEEQISCDDLVAFACDLLRISPNAAATKSSIASSIDAFLGARSLSLLGFTPCVSFVESIACSDVLAEGRLFGLSALSYKLDLPNKPNWFEHICYAKYLDVNHVKESESIYTAQLTELKQKLTKDDLFHCFSKLNFDVTSSEINKLSIDDSLGMSYFQFLYVYYKLKEKEKLSKESVTEMDTFDLAKTSSEKSWSLLQKMEEIKSWIHIMLGVRISSINEFRDGKLLYELIHNIFPNVSEAHKSKCDEDNTLLQSKHRMEVVLDILKSEGYASNVEDREKFVCRADGNNAILFVYSILEFIASKSDIPFYHFDYARENDHTQTSDAIIIKSDMIEEFNTEFEIAEKAENITFYAAVLDLLNIIEKNNEITLGKNKTTADYENTSSTTKTYRLAYCDTDALSSGYKTSLEHYGNHNIINEQQQQQQHTQNEKQIKQKEEIYQNDNHKEQNIQQNSLQQNQKQQQEKDNQHQNETQKEQDFPQNKQNDELQTVQQTENDSQQQGLDRKNQQHSSIVTTASAASLEQENDTERGANQTIKLLREENERLRKELTNVRTSHPTVLPGSPFKSRSGDFFGYEIRCRDQKIERLGEQLAKSEAELMRLRGELQRMTKKRAKEVEKRDEAALIACCRRTEAEQAIARQKRAELQLAYASQEQERAAEQARIRLAREQTAFLQNLRLADRIGVSLNSVERDARELEARRDAMKLVLDADFAALMRKSKQMESELSSLRKTVAGQYPTATSAATRRPSTAEKTRQSQPSRLSLTPQRVPHYATPLESKSRPRVTEGGAAQSPSTPMKARRQK